MGQAAPKVAAWRKTVACCGPQFQPLLALLVRLALYSNWSGVAACLAPGTRQQATNWQQPELKHPAGLAGETPDTISRASKPAQAACQECMPRVLTYLATAGTRQRLHAAHPGAHEIEAVHEAPSSVPNIAQHLPSRRAQSTQAGVWPQSHVRGCLLWWRWL